MEWHTDVLLAPFTTFKIGGRARRFIPVKSEDELRAVCREAPTAGEAFFILGGGSNVLLADNGIDATVIKNEIESIRHDIDGTSVRLTAGAGVMWDDLVSYAVTHDWWGIENLSGIPGSVGAVPIQNVGAYGVEVKEVITEVRAYHPRTDAFVTLANEECEFSYRDSIFKHDRSDLIVTSVSFLLSTIPTVRLAYRDLALRFANNPTPSLQDIRSVVIEIRAGKFPDLTTVGCAGSTFKNPIITNAQYHDLSVQFPDMPKYPVDDAHVKIPLGYVLERLGWKGFRDGNCGTWHAQALVVVNFGGATSNEIQSLIARITDDVFAKTKIKIETEIVIK